MSGSALILSAATLERRGGTSKASAPGAVAATVRAEATVPTAPSPATAPAVLPSPAATPPFSPNPNPLDPIIDLHAGTVLRSLPAFRYQIARRGQALWVEKPDGLELQTFDGRVLDRISGTNLSATYLRESDDGRVRVYGSRASRQGWFVQSVGESPQAMPEGYAFEVSPDGRYIAFLAGSAEARFTSLMVLTTSTGTARLVAEMPRCQCDGPPPPSWSQSGRFLTYEFLKTPGGDSVIFAPDTSSSIVLGGRVGNWAPDRDVLTITRDGWLRVHSMVTGEDQPVLEASTGFFVEPHLVQYRLDPTSSTGWGLFHTTTGRGLGGVDYRLHASSSVSASLADSWVVLAPTGTCQGQRIVDIGGRAPELCLAGVTATISPDRGAVAVLRGTRACAPTKDATVILASLPAGTEQARYTLPGDVDGFRTLRWSGDSRFLILHSTACGL